MGFLMILQVDPDVTGTLTAVIVALGVLLVALLGIAAKVLGYAKVGAHQATAANRATNGIDEGEHRLYDMVLRMDEKLHVLVDAHEDFHDRGWHRLDGDLADATKLTMTIRQLQAAADSDKEAHKQLRTELAELMAFVKEHDEWERTHKVHDEWERTHKLPDGNKWATSDHNSKDDRDD